MLFWINSKEFFIRPTITRNPYKESKLYKKAYVLGIVNFIIFIIYIVCLIVYFILCVFDYSGVFVKITVYIIVVNLALDMFLYVTIYEIGKHKWEIQRRIKEMRSLGNRVEN